MPLYSTWDDPMNPFKQKMDSSEIKGGVFSVVKS